MSLMPRNELGIPYEADPHVNIAVLLFSVAATLLCGVFFGCAPAWHASRQNVGDLLKEGGGRRREAGTIDCAGCSSIAEFALALILVGGAGLMLRSFWNVTQVDHRAFAGTTYSHLPCRSSTTASPKPSRFAPYTKN